MNSDRGVDGKSDNVAAGGLMRDHKEDWVVGYGRNLEVSWVMKAELHVILDGVRIAWDKRVRRLLVESDSRITVDSILGIGRIGAHKVGSEVCDSMKRD